jgi:hypothetical protein
MRYLALALYGEGPTDYQFLMPLLPRAAEDLCCRLGREEATVGEVIPLDPPADVRGRPRDEQVLAAVHPIAEAVDILVLHTDANGDARRAEAERIRPSRERINTELSWPPQRVVGAVPSCMIEAWALADGDALRSAFGTTLDDAALGLPRLAHQLESLLEPGSTLDRAYLAVTGPRRGRRARAADFLEIIARTIRLERLRLLASYQQFEEELEAALRLLHFLR